MISESADYRRSGVGIRFCGVGWLLGAPVADLEWAGALLAVLGACLRGLLAGLLLPLLLSGRRVLARSLLAAGRACTAGAGAAG